MDTDNGLDQDIADAIFLYRMSPAQSLAAPTDRHPTTSMELWGGSQRNMWLFGALLVDASTLPRTGMLTRTLQSEGELNERIELRLEDNIGFGLVDPLTARRFRRLFSQIAATIEEAIRANSHTVSDAPSVWE